MTTISSAGTNLYVPRKPASVATTLPANFKRLRELVGLTQEELGRRAGLNRVEVLAIEKGKNKLTSARMLDSLARGLGTQPDVIRALRDGTMSPEEVAEAISTGAAPVPTATPTPAPARVYEPEQAPPVLTLRDRVIDALVTQGVARDHGEAYTVVRGIAFQGGTDLDLYLEASRLIREARRPDKPELGQRVLQHAGAPMVVAPGVDSEAAKASVDKATGRKVDPAQKGGSKSGGLPHVVPGAAKRAHKP